MSIDPTTCSANSTANSHLANSQFKQASRVLDAIGWNSPVIKSALETGGGGSGPFIALADDVNQAKVSWVAGNTLTTAFVGTEIAFDVYELSASLAKTMPNLQWLEKITDVVGPWAMGIKILGGVGLAATSIAETSSLLNTSSSSGASSPNQPASLSQKVYSVLRATEVSAAAVSNIALLVGGESNPIYTTASLVSNSAKMGRMIFPQIFTISTKEVEIHYIWKTRKKPSRKKSTSGNKRSSNSPKSSYTVINTPTRLQGNGFTPIKIPSSEMMKTPAHRTYSNHSTPTTEKDAPPKHVKKLFSSPTVSPIANAARNAKNNNPTPKNLKLSPPLPSSIIKTPPQAPQKKHLPINTPFPPRNNVSLQSPGTFSSPSKQST